MTNSPEASRCVTRSDRRTDRHASVSAQMSQHQPRPEGRSWSSHSPSKIRRPSSRAPDASVWRSRRRPHPCSGGTSRIVPNVTGFRDAVPSRAHRGAPPPLPQRLQLGEQRSIGRARACHDRHWHGDSRHGDASVVVDRFPSLIAVAAWSADMPRSFRICVRPAAVPLIRASSVWVTATEERLLRAPARSDERSAS